MATTRLIRTTSSSRRPVGLGRTPSSSSSSSSSSSQLSSTTNVRLVRCINSKLEGFSSGQYREKSSSDGDIRKPPVVAVKAAATMSTAGFGSSVGDAVTAVINQRALDLGYLVAIVKVAVVRGLRVAAKPRPWKLLLQMFIEKGIIDCRFFTMFAVAGSLLGSVLCFLEGCHLVIESYLHYFHAISHKSDQGLIIVHLLIESIDMFLVGTAMLIFGMGLHVMFVGSQNLKGKGSQLPASNLFRLFYLKKVPSWIGMKSITEAKSRIGHALMMILQVGLLDQFKSIPLVTSLDLACFAGAVFISSAGLFLLSRLSHDVGTDHY